MIDWSKPVQTRNGCEVIIYTRESTSSNEFPIVGEFRSSDDGKWHLIRWRADGTYRPCVDNSMDLVNAPEEPKKHTLWLNFYKAKGGFFVASYSDVDEANDASSGDRIACLKVEFQEGEGIENYQPPEPKRSWP